MAVAPSSMQVRRRVQVWRYRLTTLRRRPVTLHEFYAATTAAYSARRFRRQLRPVELQQLACHAGFPLPAAVSLAACLEAAEPSRGAAKLQQSLQRISLVGITPWRFRFFLWWFKRWGPPVFPFWGRRGCVQACCRLGLAAAYAQRHEPAWQQRVALGAATRGNRHPPTRRFQGALRHPCLAWAAPPA